LEHLALHTGALEFLLERVVRIRCYAPCGIWIARLIGSVTGIVVCPQILIFKFVFTPPAHCHRSTCPFFLSEPSTWSSSGRIIEIL